MQYVYDGWDIVQEIENGVIAANYLRTQNIDEPLVRLTPTTSRFYHLDALGSVIALVDEMGAVKTQYTYDPFGNVTISGENSDNPFQYTGRENDGTGLYYYRARYYSPELQRFISEDPIGFAGGINFYAYVQNNPINYRDILGYSTDAEECRREAGDRLDKCLKGATELYRWWVQQADISLQECFKLCNKLKIDYGVESCKILCETYYNYTKAWVYIEYMTINAACYAIYGIQILACGDC